MVMQNMARLVAAWGLSTGLQPPWGTCHNQPSIQSKSPKTKPCNTLRCGHDVGFNHRHHSKEVQRTHHHIIMSVYSFHGSFHRHRGRQYAHTSTEGGLEGICGPMYVQSYVYVCIYTHINTMFSSHLSRNICMYIYAVKLAGPIFAILTIRFWSNFRGRFWTNVVLANFIVVSVNLCVKNSFWFCLLVVRQLSKNDLFWDKSKKLSGQGSLVRDASVREWGVAVRWWHR